MAIKGTPGPEEHLPQPAAKSAPKATPRKAGHILDTAGAQHEEHIPEVEKQREIHVDQEQKQEKVEQKKTKGVKKPRTDIDEDDEDKKQKKRDGEGGGQSNTTAGHLAHDDNFQRTRAQRLGLDLTPGMGEVLGGLNKPAAGESLAELLPSSRMRAHPDLPEVELRPPEFLTGLEAMTDVYMKTRGRMSRKTKELLAGVDLEDLLMFVRRIFENDKLAKNGEAHVRGVLYQKLKPDPGPLLLGLNDPRLTEPWRLFLDGWDVWLPEKKTDGVELFWEGEAEDDDGSTLEMTQSLSYRNAELTLYTRLGELEDRLTFDGSAYYRLKHEL